MAETDSRLRTLRCATMSESIPTALTATESGRPALAAPELATIAASASRSAATLPATAGVIPARSGIRRGRIGARVQICWMRCDSAAWLQFILPVEDDLFPGFKSLADYTQISFGKIHLDGPGLCLRIRSDNINESSLRAVLNRSGGYNDGAISNAKKQANIHELIRPER